MKNSEIQAGTDYAYMMLRGRNESTLYAARVTVVSTGLTGALDGWAKPMVMVDPATINVPASGFMHNGAVVYFANDTLNKQNGKPGVLIYKHDTDEYLMVASRTIVETWEQNEAARELYRAAREREATERAINKALREAEVEGIVTRHPADVLDSIGLDATTLRQYVDYDGTSTSRIIKAFLAGVIAGSEALATV